MIGQRVRGDMVSQRKTKKRKEKVTTVEKEETAAGAGAADDAKDGEDHASNICCRGSRKERRGNERWRNERARGVKKRLRKWCAENREAGQVSSRARGDRRKGEIRGGDEKRTKTKRTMRPGDLKDDQRMKIVMVMMRTQICRQAAVKEEDQSGIEITL